MPYLDSLIITDLNDLMSVQEASALTGRSRRTIYKWVSDGKIWSTIVADKIMLHKDDVERIKGL
jgi:excisionase family DNA binding protein